jgi:homoserine O-acetyltransferase
MVKAQHMLLTQHLGITHLLAVTGISSGALYVLQYAVSYPGFMDGIVPIVGGAFGGTAGSLPDETMPSIIESCVGWNGGNYDVNPQACATNSLSVLVARFYTRDWWEQHVDTPEAYQRWRVAMGAFYLDVQDTRDLYYLMRSFGTSSIGSTPGFSGDDMAALRSIKAKALFIYNPKDEFGPPHKFEIQVKAIPGAKGVAIDSLAGHTIWYSADPQATVAMSQAIKRFLSELTASKTAAAR